MSENTKGFKLNYSGNLEEIQEEDLLKSFNPFDILTFYKGDLKKLYIWIGKKAPQSLKTHIPSIREIFLRDYPNLKILRNITVEVGSEPTDFFNTINISEQKYKENLKEIEIKLLPVLSEINRLKDEIDRNFISENFEEAIKIAHKVIELAKSIEYKALEVNQRSFIEEANSRAKAKKIISEIEEECTYKMNIFENLNKAGNYKDAHKIVEEFRNKYKNEVNLFAIPLAQELILKDENMLYNLREEQQSLKHNFKILENDFNATIKNNKLHEAELTLEKMHVLSKKIIDEEFSTQWELLENTLFIKKGNNIQQIEELGEDAIKFLEKHEIVKANNIYKEIIEILEQILE